MDFNSLTNRVRQMLGGVQQQGVRTLSDIGSNLKWAGNQTQQNIGKPLQQVVQNVGNRMGSNLSLLNKVPQATAQYFTNPQQFNQTLNQNIKHPGLGLAVKLPSLTGQATVDLVKQGVPSALKLSSYVSPAMATARNTGAYKFLNEPIKGKDILNTAGLIGAFNPVSNVIGGSVGTGFKVLENAAFKKPLNQGLDEAYKEGYKFSATLSPVEGLTSFVSAPVLAKLSKQFPVISKVITKLTPGEVTGFKSWVANILKQGNKSGLSMSVFGALQDTKNGEETLKNIWDQYKLGFAFGAGGQGIKTAIPGVIKPLMSKFPSMTSSQRSFARQGMIGNVRSMHPEDLDIFDRVNTIIQNPKKFSKEDVTRANQYMYLFAEKYLPNKLQPDNANAKQIANRLQKRMGQGDLQTFEGGFAKLDEPIVGTGKVDTPTGRIQNQDLLNEARKYKSAEEFINKGEVTKATSDIQNRSMAEQSEIVVPKVQTEVPKTSKVLPSSASGGSIPKPEDVAATLPSRVDSFIQKTLGYSTEAPRGGAKGASRYTMTLRKGQEAITSKVETGLGSENKYVRNAASTLQGFFKGLGMSPERAQASMELRGSMGVANERAYNVMDSLYKSLDNNPQSLERINAVLDPNIAKTKVTFDQLSPTEKQVYGIIREGLDIVHDTSYANGNISKELYVQNKGKYTPRLYDVTEIPPEVNKFVTQGKKIVTDLYKSRKELDQWKVDNSLNDPVYGLGKRLAQVETNKAIRQYTDFLASNPRFVSDIERPGFTKLSDSPAYGALSGKFVLNSAAEDLKGHFFSNQAMQNLYDVFRAYDRLPVRQLQKKLLTVFNPTTNVGNIVSDQVFGWVTGVDPLTLNKNLLEFKNNPSSYKQITDYLMKRGVVGTDITRTDFVNKLGQIDELALGKKPGVLKVASEKLQSFYGGTDDIYKASAFKALLDKGFSLEEATRKVADGFQNYANVGKFYDVWAKTPVVGSAFIKFQGDLIRIIKNGAVNNPLGLISFLGTLWGVARLASKVSGETDRDRETRENRFGAPMIPGLNIPLTWQTPWGEINVARYVSPFYANNDVTNVAKILPFVPTIDTKKDLASNVAINTNDPFLSAPVQLLVNRDFRGKPISDPNESKYQPSTLTPQEKLINQAKFTGRAYLPPPVNSLLDVGSAIKGGKNMYGAKQSVPQAVARLGGIKIQQFGAEEAQQQRNRDAEYEQYKNESVDKQISAITKQLLKGEIDEQKAKERINYFNNQKTQPTTVPTEPPKNNKYQGKITNLGGEYSYLDKNGNQIKADNQRDAEIGVEKVLFQDSNENIRDLGDVVLRKSVDGKVTVTKRDDYDSSLNTQKMTQYTKSGDYKAWMETAEKQIQIYERQLKNPQTDELDQITIQNKIDALTKKMGTYKSYGGFKKPKKAPKITIKKLSAPKVARIRVGKIKLPKVKLKKPLKLKKYTVKLSR